MLGEVATVAYEHPVYRQIPDGPYQYREMLGALWRVAHGENTILVLRYGLPTRVVLKDLVEEVQVSRRHWHELPAELRGLLYNLDEQLIPLFILTDVFDGFFRYLSDVLATHCGLPEDRFWRLVTGVVQDYQDDHPKLARS